LAPLFLRVKRYFKYSLIVNSSINGVFSGKKPKRALIFSGSFIALILSIIISPESGSVSVDKHFKVVVFPAPLGPIKPINSPAFI